MLVFHLLSDAHYQILVNTSDYDEIIRKYHYYSERFIDEKFRIERIRC